MVSKRWRATRPKQLNGKKIMELEQTVKQVLHNVETPALVNPASELLKEVAELKAKLTAALEQGAMEAMKARRLTDVEAERDALKAQLEALTVTQPMPVAVTNHVECSIRVDVKAPDLADWVNNGWCVKHYQFIDNDRSVPSLAVVMERPAVPAPHIEDEYHYSVAPQADTPSNAESAPVNKPVAYFEFITEEPELVPSMAAPVTILPEEITITSDPTGLLKKLAANKPIFAAITEYGVDAVIEAMDAQVYEKARAAYDAYPTADTPPHRFESLLTTGTVTPDSITLETDEIEVVLS